MKKSTLEVTSEEVKYMLNLLDNYWPVDDPLAALNYQLAQKLLVIDKEMENVR